MPELFSQHQFDDQLAADSLPLTLVGPSNNGKSYQSAKLAVPNPDFPTFNRVCCDDLIETDLAELLTAEGYSGGIADVAAWMGQPYEERSPANQRRYLEIEDAVMIGTVAQLQQGITRNTVIDTTGSVVHTDIRIQQALSKLSLVVHIAATPDMRDAMSRQFFTCPKPIIWGKEGELFVTQPGLDPEVNLIISHPNLVTARHRLYEAMAHVTIPRPALEGVETASQFLGCIRELLPT